MIGTYTYNPKNLNKITLSDIEQFVLSLLKDICSTSLNLNLQACKVNYLAEMNLGDEAQDGTKGLVAFFLAENNPNNVNLNARHNDDGTNIHVAYDIGLTTKVDGLSPDEHNKMLQEIINGITDNYNNGVNYTITIGMQTLSSVLSLNRAGVVPQRFLEKESEINYLTSIMNIVFTIAKY